MQFPLLLGLGFVILCFFLAAGKITRFLQTPFALPWLAVLALYGLASVFGIYRGRSVPFVATYGLRIHLTIAFFFCGIALTTNQIRKLMHFMAAGAIVVLVLCWKYGQADEGRLAIPETMLANANDLAFHLVYGSAFLLSLLLMKSTVTRLLWLFSSSITIIYVLKTGSRANFLTLIVVALAVLLIARTRTRLLLLLLAPLLSLSLLFVPETTLQRLKLITPDSEPARQELADKQLSSALESQATRMTLQARAIELALRHPLLGVGPGNFSDAVEDMVQGQGKGKSGWQASHNCYLQIAAENGIPAMLFYAWSIWLCIRFNYQWHKRYRDRQDGKEIADQSLCLLLASVIYAFGTAFSNVAYYPYLTLLVGFSAANYLVIKEKEMLEAAGEKR